MRQLLLFLLMLSCIGSLRAQELTAPTLVGQWQSTYTNPALLQQLPNTLTIGLPGVSTGIVIDEVTIDKLFTFEGDRRILELGRVLPDLDGRNSINSFFQFETLGVGLRFGNWAAGISHRIRTREEFRYSRTLAELIAEGNSQFVGQTVEIAPFGYFVGYQELGLGLSYRSAGGFSVGGRINLLSGIGDLRSDESGSIAITTGVENYAITLAQDYRIRTAGLIDYNGLGDITSNYNLNRLTFDEIVSGNLGMSFDLGVSYEFEDVLFHASATGLGAAIQWKARANQLTFQGEDFFGGLDALESFLTDSISLAGITDSITNALEPERSTAGYRGELGSAYYLGANYAPVEGAEFSAMVAYFDEFGEQNLGFSVGGRYALVNWLTAGVNFNYHGWRGGQLGVHLVFAPGPFRVFVASDNIFSATRWSSTNSANVRIGGSLLLGERLTRWPEG